MYTWSKTILGPPGICNMQGRKILKFKPLHVLSTVPLEGECVS